MKLSVLVPSIRPYNLNRLYESIKNSCSHKFEMIVIGPYELPEELRGKKDVIYIADWGSPLRAQQIGLCSAQGEYISWAADDGVYLTGALDIAFRLLEGKDYKTVVMGKYQEGDRKDDHMEQDKYYILNNHFGSNAAFIPENCWMLNCGVVSRKILLEIGGWDSYKFHTCPPGYNDLAVRLQKYDCKFIIQKEMMFSCSHLPGLLGDHAPIHNIQTMRDEPMFKEIWSHPFYSKRIAVDLKNWIKAPERWTPRFGEKR